MARKPKTAAIDAALAKRGQRASALFDATLKNLPDLVQGAGPGALDALGRVYGVGKKYVQSRTPQQVAGDVAKGLGAVGDATARYAKDRAQNPLKLLGDAYGVGEDIVTAVPQAVGDVAQLSERAQALKATDPAAARRMQAGIAMAAMGVMPGVRTGKKVAKAVDEAEKLAAKYGTDLPKVRVDNPGGEWLVSKQRYAEEDMVKAAKAGYAPGAPRGPITGYLDKPMLLDPAKLARLPGAMKEAPKPGDPKYDALMKSMSKKGYDPDQNNAILVGISHRGEPYIIEGNNRAAVARDLGLPAIPAEVRWYAGGEQAPGALSPDKLADYAYRPAPAAEKLAAKYGVAAPAVIRAESGAAKRAPSAGIDREKLRERYPDPAPPEMKWDKTKQRFYPGKGSDTPEIAALTKARQNVMADIKKGNYTPMFDISKRAYVDPADYPLVGSTLTDTLPKREATLATYTAKANDPEALDRLSAAYNSQKDNPNAAHWYAMLQWQNAFVQKYGPEKGRALFKRWFADSMAGTTGGADPATNLRSAGYLNHLDATGASPPLTAHDIPYPVSGGKHGALNNVVLAKKLLDDPAVFTAAMYPKRHNFSANFLGHRDRPTVDEQMMGAWDPTGETGQPAFYAPYEAVVNRLAEQHGVDPINFQDVGWAGLKLLKTPKFEPHPMMTEINEAIERNSRVLGLSPDDAMDHILSGGPVYARGGAVDVDKLATKYGVSGGR